MGKALSLAAALTLGSALAVVRARRRMGARVALVIHGLSLALLLAVLSMPLLALMVAVLGVGMALVDSLARREVFSDVSLAEDSLGVWSLMGDAALLFFVLLFWWWLGRPTFVEGLVQTGADMRPTSVEVVAFLYTRYAGPLLGVGLTLLAAAIGAGRQREGE